MLKFAAGCWVMMAVTGPGYKLRVNLQATLSRHKAISLSSGVCRYHRHHAGVQGAMCRRVQTVLKAPGFLGRMLDSYDIWTSFGFYEFSPLSPGCCWPGGGAAWLQPDHLPPARGTEQTWAGLRGDAALQRDVMKWLFSIWQRGLDNLWGRCPGIIKGRVKIFITYLTTYIM